MSPVEKEVLLWDWDDLFSGGPEVQNLALRNALNRLGIEKDTDDFCDALRDYPLPDEVRLLPRYLWGVDLDFWQEVNVLYRQFTPVPSGVDATLDELSQRWRLGAQGSAPVETVELLLRERGWSSEFEFMGGGDQLDHGKPDPEFFLRALDRWGVPEEKAVVLTRSSGARAAQSAGIDYILIPDNETRVLDPLWQSSWCNVCSLKDLSRHL